LSYLVAISKGWKRRTAHDISRSVAQAARTRRHVDSIGFDKAWKLPDIEKA
jgi:hypothetical protein